MTILVRSRLTRPPQASSVVLAELCGMTVIALPNRDFPPTPEGLAAADVVIDSLYALTPEKIELVAA